MKHSLHRKFEKRILFILMQYGGKCDKVSPELHHHSIDILFTAKN